MENRVLLKEKRCINTNSGASKNESNGYCYKGWLLVPRISKIPLEIECDCDNVAISVLVLCYFAILDRYKNASLRVIQECRNTEKLLSSTLNQLENRLLS